MKEQIASVTETAIELASNPKAGAAVAAGSVSTGTAFKFHLITGVVADVSIWLGACTAAVVLAIQVLKLIRELRAPSGDRD